jgi:hypothetical protein
VFSAAIVTWRHPPRPRRPEKPRRQAAAVGRSAEAATRIGCVTCHRGVAIPKQLADILDQTAMEKGTQAAVAQYKDLRKQYFGAQAYDFSEGSLVTYAQRAKNDTAAAIKSLEKAVELDPQNAQLKRQLDQLKGQ